jgi:DNA-directed RNA polymerase specialized sigma24 family protein
MTVKGEGLARETPASQPLLSDPAQFDGLYRRYFLPLVRRATWKYHLEKEDARDVVQEAFVVALAKLDPKKNPKAWLIQVVDHLSSNFQRKVARRAKLVSRWSRYDGGDVANPDVHQNDSGCDALSDGEDIDNY